MNFMRTKAISHSDHGLKRCLNAWDLTLLGIGCTIGTGIFVLTGVAAAEHAGPAIIVAFILCGIACALTALCYSELASAVGGSGSAYGYAYTGIGEIVAWIIGWDLLLEYAVSTATVSIGWSGYFNKILSGFFGITLPFEWTAAPSESMTLADGTILNGICNVPAMTVVMVMALLLCWGVKEAARFNGVMVVIKVLTIMVFLALAAPHVSVENWTPFIPNEVTTPEGGHRYGAMGIFTAAALVFFAYIGFDAVSTAGEETLNPQRNLPLGILGSLAFCTIVYILVSGVLTGVVPYQNIDIKAPIAAAMGSLGYPWAQGLVATGAIFGLTTVMLVLYYGLTRVTLAMANDGLLPRPLGYVHAKTQTPIPLILGAGVFIALIAGLSPISRVAELVNIGTLFAFVLVCASVIILRKTRPDMERPFKTPYVPVVPILGIIFCLLLMIGLPVLTWERFVGWMTLGLLVYFVYSYRSSDLQHKLSPEQRKKLTQLTLGMLVVNIAVGAYIYSHKDMDLEQSLGSAMVSSVKQLIEK